MYTHFEDKILRTIAGEDKPQVVSDNYKYGFEQCIKINMTFSCKCEE